MIIFNGKISSAGLFLVLRKKKQILIFKTRNEKQN